MDFKVVTVLSLPTAVICLAASNAPNARPAAGELPQITAKALLSGEVRLPPPVSDVVVVTSPAQAIVAENAAPAFDWQKAADAWHDVCRSLQERGMAVQQSLQFLTIRPDAAAPMESPDRVALAKLNGDVREALSDLWGGAFFENFRARCSAWSEKGDISELLHPMGEHLFVSSTAR
jgi:hypothetical protein